MAREGARPVRAHHRHHH